MVKTKDITNILMEEIFVYILLRKVRNKKKKTKTKTKNYLSSNLVNTRTSKVGIVAFKPMLEDVIRTFGNS